MDKFFVELNRFMKKRNQLENTTDNIFEYSETTQIDSDIAQMLWEMWKDTNNLQSMYDKEADYNRLLRKENNELLDTIDDLYDQLNSQDTQLVIDISNELGLINYGVDFQPLCVNKAKEACCYLRAHRGAL